MKTCIDEYRSQGNVRFQKKIQKFLNHFGYCIDYRVAEEYEISIDETIVAKQKALPDGLKEEKGLSTLVA